MANVSSTRKLGIAARIAGEQVKRSRTYGALLSGARATFSHFGAVLRQLWLEVTGFVFVAFALVGGGALVKELSAYHAGNGAFSKVSAAAGFTLMFAWFGASSFYKARNRK
jgi:putative exporter of polyketide antibiotics